MIFTVIDIDTGYINRPNWLPAGYYVYNRVASRAFPRVPSPLCLWQACKVGTSEGAVRDPHMFMTGSRSRHRQQRCLHAGRPGGTLWQISDRVYPGVQYCNRLCVWKFLVRYIVTGCIFCAPGDLWQGQVLNPPAAPPLPSWDSSSPPPPPGKKKPYVYNDASL